MRTPTQAELEYEAKWCAAHNWQPVVEDRGWYFDVTAHYGSELGQIIIATTSRLYGEFFDSETAAHAALAVVLADCLKACSLEVK